MIQESSGIGCSSGIWYYTRVTRDGEKRWYFNTYLEAEAAEKKYLVKKYEEECSMALLHGRSMPDRPRFLSEDLE